MSGWDFGLVDDEDYLERCTMFSAAAHQRSGLSNAHTAQTPDPLYADGWPGAIGG